MRISDWSSDLCSSDLLEKTSPKSRASAELDTGVTHGRHREARHVVEKPREILVPSAGPGERDVLVVDELPDRFDRLGDAFKGAGDLHADRVETCVRIGPNNV